MTPLPIKLIFEKLIIVLGELDNENETRGTLLRSTTADLQGKSRLDRGNNFYRFGKVIAKEMSAEFQWDLIEVKGVGHDHRKMGDAICQLYYDK